MKKRMVQFGALIAVFGFGACGSDSDPVSPTLESVAGTYNAIAFVADGVDILAAGATLTLTLGEDQTVSGSLFAPAEAGGPFEADMAGTYTLNGNSLTFEQVADSFVRDASWEWSNGVLEGVFGDEVSVRLIR